MSTRIQTNVQAFNAYRNLNNTSNEISKSMEKLSSGFRINRAADDASGLAISERLKSQQTGLSQAQRNVGDATSLLQTGEGALDQVHSMLQRTRELGVKYNNATLSDTDKTAIADEVTALGAEVSRIAGETKYNGISLLSGAATLDFQVGADDSQTISVTVDDLIGTGSGQVDSGIFSFTGTITLADIDEAITNVSARRAQLGAVQNRLEYTGKNLAIYESNVQDSLSRIKDTDMALEMVNYTKAGILSQAGTSMLAQANSSGQGVLSLLR